MRLPPAAEVETHVLSMPLVAEGCDRVAGQVEAEAAGLAFERAIDSAEYLHGIRRVVTAGPGALVRAHDKKSQWIEDGTGVYGPRHSPIVPTGTNKRTGKKNEFLVFRVREFGSSIRAGVSGQVKESGLIFARSVRGRPASHVMRDASRAVAARLGLRWTDHRGKGRPSTP